MAADSLATDDACGLYVSKLRRLPRGDIAGGCGDLNEIVLALSWLAAGGKGESPAIPTASILYTKDGIPHLACTGWPGIALKGHAAIGSGAQGALVAMRLGKSAEDAVKAVSDIDRATGGEVDVMAYIKPRTRK
jgi:hypothetical protein